MLHTGYVDAGAVTFVRPGGETIGLDMKGCPYGIGGALKLGFGKYLRIGTEGYVSTLNYAKNHSFESIGWGGLLVDGVFPLGKWMPFAGLTIGGGSVKNITALESSTSDFMLDNGTTSYRRYAFLALAPFTGVEYILTERVHLVLKADYLINLSSRQPDFVHGPRLYFGFMFCH